MAKRNRVIYQSEAVFVGPSPSSGVHYEEFQYSGIADNSGVQIGGVDDGQTFNVPEIDSSGDLVSGSKNYVEELLRVQSASYSFNINRQDINQFNQLAAIDRVVLEAPTVNFDTSYYLTNGQQESRLGFTIDGQVSALSGILNRSEDEKNYFVLTVPEGSDAANNTNRSDHNVISIGNGFMTNYSVEASVGDIPTASVSAEALNIKVDPNSSGHYIPAINPENGEKVTGVTYRLPTSQEGTGMIAALRPGDISLSLRTPFGAKLPGQYSEGTSHVQNFSLQVPVGREPLQRLGSSFAFSREITFPVTITLNATANLADLESGNLADVICEDEDYDLEIVMNEPNCSGGVPDTALKYTLKGAKLDSQSFSSSIGSNKSVDLSWSVQIGGPEDLNHGFFISGSYNE